MTPRLADVVEIDVPREPLRQPPAVLQALYRKHSEGYRQRATRKGLWIAVSVYLLFSITDLLIIPDVAPYTVATRFVISAIMLIALEVQIYRRSSADAVDGTSAAALVFAYAGWLYVSLWTDHTSVMSYYMVFGAIFMMSVNLFFSFPFKLSLIASLVIVLLFFAGLLSFPPEIEAYKLTFGLFCGSCFVFTSYVNWKLNQERYNVFLSGLEAKAQQKEATDRGEALFRLSHTDFLTGLENRRAIDNRLRDLWGAWRKNGRRFAVVLVDVDFFKRYNDGYGHQQGDRCLMLVADALKSLADSRGVSIGRYGGEEFILLAHMEEEGELQELTETIRTTIEELGLLHEQRRDGMSTVTVSVGAAFTRDEGGSKVEKLVHQADRALYSAKAAGRNCIRLFDPDDPNNRDDSENIAALLKIAVAQDLVSLVYQPLQDLSSGRVQAVEALMRLKMLDGTNIPPSLFILAAERTGAIIELGKWAILRVCQEVLAPGLAQVASVNVSPLQLRVPGFADFVARTLQQCDVAGDRLALEITEGQDMEFHSSSLRCISDLKALGVKIWLDDFGTGFAGLSWLRLIDFDCIKIDKSFLHDCDTAAGRAMLEDIIGLIRNRGAGILVEGVETEEQLALVRKLHVDLVQGFHVGHPAPAGALTPLDPAPAGPGALLKVVSAGS